MYSELTAKHFNIRNLTLNDKKLKLHKNTFRLFWDFYLPPFWRAVLCHSDRSNLFSINHHSQCFSIFRFVNSYIPKLYKFLIALKCAP